MAKKHNKKQTKYTIIGLIIGGIIGIVLAFGLLVGYHLFLATIIGTMILVPVFCSDLPSSGVTDAQMQECLNSIANGLNIPALIILVIATGLGGLIGYLVGRK